MLCPQRLIVSSHLVSLLAPVQRCRVDGFLPCSLQGGFSAFPRRKAHEADGSIKLHRRSGYPGNAKMPRIAGHPQ